MKTCKADGCNRTDIKAKGYCGKHYTQIRRHGKILDKTRFDLNEIIIHEDYAEIILYDKKGNEKARALIDLDDIDKVKEYRWHLDDSNGYISNNTIGYQHRFIMNCPEDKVVDHINHNSLDNRKCNLRVCNSSQNNANKGIQSNNTSGYTGVCWYKAGSKWQVSIKVNYKSIFLGYYDDLEEAIKVRKEAEIKYFGEYRNKE